jgi:hypothetical protein
MHHSVGTAIGAGVFHDGSRPVYAITKISDDGPTLHVRLTGTVDTHGKPGTYLPTGNEEIRRGWRTQFDRIELKSSFGYRVPIGTGIDYAREFGLRSVFDIYSVNSDGSYQARYIGFLSPEDGRFHQSDGKLSPDEPSYEPICETPSGGLEVVALHPGVINREPVGHAVGHENDEDDMISCHDILSISPSGSAVSVRRTGYLTKQDGTFVAKDHPERADYTRAFTHIQLGPKAQRLQPLGVAISPFLGTKHRNVYDVFSVRDGGATLYVTRAGIITEGSNEHRDGFHKQVESYPVPVTAITSDMVDILVITD